MAVPQNVQLDTDTGTLQIQDLEITDSTVIDYFDQHESDDPEEILRFALRVGVSTLTLSETSEEAEFVKHEFDKISTEFESEIDDLRRELEARFGDDDGDLPALLDQYLGEDGHVRSHLQDAFDEEGELDDRLDDHLGKDGRLVSDVFDPTDSDTPLGELRDEIEREIDKLRDDLVREEGREEVEQETRIKGEQFEDDLGVLLEEIHEHKPTVEVKQTGDDHGEIDDRFVGDFVLTLETGQDIVIEAKDVSQLSKPEIKRQLEDGMENRGADYGVLVLKNVEASPQKIGWFQEFDQRMLYVALSDEERDSYDDRLLRIACEWARMRTFDRKVETAETIDTEFIRTKVNEVEDSISQFQQLRKQCTNIKNARESIEDQIDDIEETVEEELDSVVEELNTAT